MSPRTRYLGGRIHAPGHPAATALVVTGDTITWIGEEADAPAADHTVDLAGRLVTPAFVDAHVHTTHTGFALTLRDLSGVRSPGELLDAVAAEADRLPAGTVVLAHGWDDSTWADPTPPDAAALLRASGGRPVYATQASMHSALAAGTVLATAEGATGYDPSGWLRRQANHAARRAAYAAIPAAQRADAQRATLRRAAGLGIAAVHECGVPGLGSEEDFTGLLALARQGGNPEVHGYWGELGAAAKARELGAVGAGGDLFADGALGARTAHVSAPYLDGNGGGARGYGYLTTDQVRDHLRECHRVGIAGGFHAIGDAALGTVLAGFAAAAKEVGVERVRAARHRIEHAELLDREMIAGLVEHGVVASVQPAFDRLWGGTDQMYARRLGRERALASNPFGGMHAVGVALAFGSDSPVTPLDPWGAVRAAAAHHQSTARITVKAAFAAHTRGGWRAVHQDHHGVLSIGAPATFAVWDTPAGVDGTLPVLQSEDPEARDRDDPTPLPACHRTVLRGVTIFDDDPA